MPPPLRFARRFLLLRLLKTSLFLGAALDLALAVLLLARPDLPARWSALPGPGATFYLRVPAILFAMVAVAALLAAHDVQRYAGLLPLTICGRLAIAVALASGLHQRPELSGLWWLSGAELAIGSGHAAFWLPIRG